MRTIQAWALCYDHVHSQRLTTVLLSDTETCFSRAPSLRHRVLVYWIHPRLMCPRRLRPDVRGLTDYVAPALNCRTLLFFVVILPSGGTVHLIRADAGATLDTTHTEGVCALYEARCCASVKVLNRQRLGDTHTSKAAIGAFRLAKSPDCH